MKCMSWSRYKTWVVFFLIFLFLEVSPTLHFTIAADPSSKQRFPTAKRQECVSGTTSIGVGAQSLAECGCHEGTMKINQEGLGPGGEGRPVVLKIGGNRTKWRVSKKLPVTTLPKISNFSLERDRFNRKIVFRPPSFFSKYVSFRGSMFLC